MAEYYNKEYYNRIKGNCTFIDLTSDNVKKVMRALYDSGINFSASFGGYRNTVTVANEDRARAMAVVNEHRFENNRNGDRIIGNTEYGKIRDKSFINTDPATAMQVANILSGDSSIRFSGRIQEKRATITVSGGKNAEMVQRLVDNIRNGDIINELSQAGFERLPDNNGFVVVRNNGTGETAGFRDMNMVRDMWNDPNNEFFHVPVYAVDKTADVERPFYISETYGQTERGVYIDSNKEAPIFAEKREAESYAADNGIFLSHQKEDAGIKDDPAIDVNLDLIDEFSKVGEHYPDVVYYDERAETFTWLHYDEYAASDGALVEKTFTEEDVFEAYMKKVGTSDETLAENAFISALNGRAESVSIPVNDPAFTDSAQRYIHMPVRGEAMSVYAVSGENPSAFNMDRFIEYLENNTAAVREDKAKREQEKAKAAVVNACYEKLKTAVFDNAYVGSAMEDTAAHHSIAVALAAAEKEAVRIFREDIYGNIDFYADFFDGEKSDSRKAFENYITETINSYFENSREKATESGAASKDEPYPEISDPIDEHPNSARLQENNISFDFSNGDKKRFTESSELRKFWEKHDNISFALGSAILEYLDEKLSTESENPALTDVYHYGYDKTDFRVSCVINGKEYDYEGRYDIGDGKEAGGGSIVNHIRSNAEHILNSESDFFTDEDKEEAQITLDILIPFLEKNSALSAEEQQIMDEYKRENPIRYEAEQDNSARLQTAALREQFVHKVQTELSDFLANPDDASKYRINTEKDIADFIIGNMKYDFSEQQYKAMLSRPHILSEIYEEWQGIDIDEWDEEDMITLNYL